MTSWRKFKPPSSTTSATAPARRVLAQLGKTTKEAQTINLLLFQLRATKMELPLPQYYFARPRLWRFDLAWPDKLIALELEGLVFPVQPKGWPEPGQPEHRLSGRHTSVRGFLADLEKYAEAFARGWAILRVRHKDVETGMALHYLERRLRATPSTVAIDFEARSSHVLSHVPSSESLAWPTTTRPRRSVTKNS